MCEFMRFLKRYGFAE